MQISKDAAVWQDVNLQDEESEARAALYRAQARAIEEGKNGNL